MSTMRATTSSKCSAASPIYVRYPSDAALASLAWWPAVIDLRYLKIPRISSHELNVR